MMKKSSGHQLSVSMAVTILGMAFSTLAVTAAAKNPSPKTIALQPGNIPASLGKGFTVTGGSVSNAQVAVADHVSVAAMNSHRVDGYATTLARQSGSGIIGLTDSIGLYKSASDAAWEYRAFVKADPIVTRVKIVHIKKLGDQSRAFIASLSTGGTTISTGEVYFQKGPYNARINITDEGKLSVAVLTTLAKLVDKRI